MAITKTQFGNAVPSFSLTFTFMAILTLGSMYSIGNPDQVFSYLPTSMLQQEAKPVMNRNNFNLRTISLIPVWDDTKNKIEESILDVLPQPKAVKSKPKIGDGKKTGWKIFWSVLFNVSTVLTGLALLFIPYFEVESYDHLIPIAIGVVIISLGIFVLSLVSLNKVNKATAHLNKPKDKSNRQ